MENNYLYYFNINNFSNEEYEKYLDFVSDYRKEKTIKYRNIEDKKLSLCSELLLRHAFKSLNIDSDYNFTFNAQSKPYLSDSNVFFNISHCKDYVICAISKDVIGCDIECIKEPNIKIAEKCFSNEEYQNIIASNDEKEKVNRFYRYWTLKESFIKNIGLGLSLPLNSFAIELNDEISIKQSVNNNRYYFEELNIDSSYKCSVCKSNALKTSIIEVLTLFSDNKSTN